MTTNLLGIDLGTSSVKALLASADGQILSLGSAEYPILYPEPGHAEQSPADWWAATITAVREALAEARVNPADIAAVGLSGQMHGTVLLDKEGHLLNPAIIWPDQRSRLQVQEIGDLIGRRRLVEIAGSPVATGFQAATLRWLQQERPDLWQRIDKILSPKDFLRWRMAGNFNTEASDGSGTLLLNVHQRAWSTEIVELLGIEIGKLLPIIRSDAIAGEISPEVAGDLGLVAGTPIVTGAADTACGMLGSGIVDDRTLLLTISTGGQILLPAAEVKIDPDGRLHTFCSAFSPACDRPGWYQMAAILSAGMSLRWLRDQIFSLPVEKAYQQMSAWAEAAPPGARGLLFLPYLVGERTPHMDPQARGLFLGLTSRHGRAELVRSVMEGVALACYDAFSILQELGAAPEQIVMAGGGARSTLWRQIVADVFNLPVRPLLAREQAALGALLLAGSGVGLFDVETAARDWASYGDPIEPDCSHSQLYQELLQIFRAGYGKHRADFRRLQAVEGGSPAGMK